MGATAGLGAQFRVDDGFGYDEQSATKSTFWASKRTDEYRLEAEN
jgi:hypothetical protein